MPSNSLDDLLPIRTLQVAGTDQPFASKLDFQVGFQTSTTTDPSTGANTLHVVNAGATVHDAAMHDASYAVAETAGVTSIGSDTPFTADRTLTLRSDADVGSVVEWCDEAIGTPSLNAHDLIVALDGAGTIQRKNASAATLTLTLGDLGGGGTISFRKMTATMWKALS